MKNDARVLYFGEYTLLLKDGRQSFRSNKELVDNIQYGKYTK